MTNKKIVGQRTCLYKGNEKQKHVLVFLEEMIINEVGCVLDWRNGQGPGL